MPSQPAASDDGQVQRPFVQRLMSDPTKIRVGRPSQEPHIAVVNELLLELLLKRAAGRRIRLNSGDGVFRLARIHLRTVVEALAREFGAVDVTLEFGSAEKCDTRCKTANPETFYECTCSCLAAHHGGRDMGPGWLQVGETTLIDPDVQQTHFVVTRRQVEDQQ